jgi:lysozyme
MREIPQVAIDFVKRVEACRLKSYQDSAGVWTIGYGHVGPEVHVGVLWTQAQADSALASDLSTAAARLASVVNRPIIDDLTDNQYAALVSFVFNLGCDPKWTIWKVLNRAQYDQVPAQLARFVYAGKVKLNGLVNRRNAEIALWSTAEPGSSDEAPPSSFTRAEPTPPAPATGIPLHAQKPFLAVASAAVLGAPAGIKQVADVVAPYADKSHYVANAVELLATAGGAAAVAGVVVLWLQSRQAKR